MERYYRALALHRVFKTARAPVTAAWIMKKFGTSRATMYRDLAFLRDVLDAPLESTRQAYYYDKEKGEGFELPGLWFRSDELHALLAAHHLLDRPDDGVLAGALAPLKTRVDELLVEHRGGKRWPMDRIRLIASGQRDLDQDVFRYTAGAVVERRRITFDYLARSTDVRSHRTVSPQRLTHYRDNWYLDAQYHCTSGGLRACGANPPYAPIRRACRSCHPERSGGSVTS
jgi:predicted DNA-binding transcriptional regulator YafY